MNKYFFYFLIVLPLYSLAQETEEEVPTVIDSLYREDQFYVGVTFNLLSNKPQDFSQNGLSAGLQAGFIRDFPINEKRNRAIGIGIGLALDTYNHNLLIARNESGNDSQYAIIDAQTDTDENGFTSYTLEAPIEYRWRTSTPTKYSFWRIHAGVRLGYIFSFKSTFKDNSLEIIRRDIPEINKLQYGPSFSFGYGAFNFQAYYGLNTLFNQDALIGEKEVNLQVIRLGLAFYFL